MSENNGGSRGTPPRHIMIYYDTVAGQYYRWKNGTTPITQIEAQKETTELQANHLARFYPLVSYMHIGFQALVEGEQDEIQADLCRSAVEL